MSGELVDAPGSYALIWWSSVALGVLAMGLHLMISDHMSRAVTHCWRWPSGRPRGSRPTRSLRSQ